MFLLQDGWPVPHAILTNWIKLILAAAGVPGNFSSHSFHRGATTVVALNGVNLDHLIQALGCWSSNAYQQLYVCTPSEALASLAYHLMWWTPLPWSMQPRTLSSDIHLYQLLEGVYLINS